MLSVQPSRGLVDEMFRIVVANLPPSQKVTIHSLFQSEDNNFWEAFGHYISDENGTVTGNKDASLGGTYKGTEPTGLLWSMRPIPGSPQALRIRKYDVLTPMVVHISVHSGHLSQGFSQKTLLAMSVIERWHVAPGVKRINIREEEVQGTLFLPPGPGPYPGVLDLWGAGGGLVEYRSALLASHGFASMALEYFGPNELSLQDVDVSYFEKAYQILKNHPMVQKDHLAVLGLSFGSVISLSIVAYSKVIKPKCCVCINGSHMIPFDKNISEFIKEMNKNVDRLRVNEENQVIYRDVFLMTRPDSPAKIDVGRIKCPLLLVASGDDQTFPAVESAEDMEMMMEKAGNRHLLEVLNYPGAGHLIEPPCTPHFRATKFCLPTMQQRVIMLWGGQTQSHAHAQEDAWNKILAFLQQHLQFNTALKT
ncbi:bile acid-CoA:amino acid N-acyltransferase-like [Pseudorasbora parva]|uniref:bile acid-CoA:amino acid N-acyltransferase-like n=1 Tax=Pseudorasbora parva TaxID=51549 RepID=UPI00351DB4BF